MATRRQQLESDLLRTRGSIMVCRRNLLALKPGQSNEVGREWLLYYLDQEKKLLADLADEGRD